MNIRAALFSTDPYEGLDQNLYPSDNHGWNDHREHFQKLVTDPKLIVEVGSWKGRSAILLAELFPTAHILCIDTWLGSKEMWTNQADPSRYGALRIRHGRPELQYEFMANVMRAGYQDRITPMPLPSSIAMDLLKDWGVSPGLCYIDGSHDYQDVRDDIFRAKLLKPAVICGDDYGSWDGVTKAIDTQKWIERNPYTFCAESSGFWWARPAS